MRQYKKIKSHCTRGITPQHSTSGDEHSSHLSARTPQLLTFLRSYVALTALANKPQSSCTDSDLVTTELLIISICTLKLFLITLN